jgi:hypothetical protein
VIGKRVDMNQPQIVAALRGAGAVWIGLSGDPHVGMDGIICYRSKVYLAEIKNGELVPSARKLTERELIRKAQVEAVGVPYNVLENVDDALRLIGVIK